MSEELISSDIREWIGRAAPEIHFEVTRRDIQKYAIATEQQLRKYVDGDEAPPMFLFGADRPLSALGELGNDGLRSETLLPDLPLKRVMAGGIKQRHYRAARPGDVLTIKREIKNIHSKQGKSGPLIFIDYLITVTDQHGKPVLEETQTRINR